MIRLHPWNTDFEWYRAAGPLHFLSNEDVEQYNEAGFVLLKGAVSADALASVIAEIDPVEAETTAFLRSQENETRGISRASEITFTPHLVKRSSVLREFCGSTLFRNITHDLIGGAVRLYWEQAVYKKPETPNEFPWHQDNGYVYIEPQQYLTCWIALTDATEENGCPWVVPGLHLKGTLEHETTALGYQCLTEAPGSVPVDAAAGDIVIFSSLTPHRTGPNLTNEVRKAYIVQFAPDGARVRPRDGGASILQNDENRQFLLA